MTNIYKRGFDIFFSLLGIILLSPVYLVIYLAVRITEGCPVIYSQERIGLNGEPFLIYKFRSMVNNTEENGTPMLAEEDDCRLTRIGRILRNTHLDELPQLWNVLKGDMSFVGPRPERKYFIERIMEHDKRYKLLYQVRPGITSNATIYNGYTNTMEKMLRRLEMDLHDMSHQSLLSDIRIIAKTVLSIMGIRR